jgi:hypothetical protein
VRGLVSGCRRRINPTDCVIFRQELAVHLQGDSFKPGGNKSRRGGRGDEAALAAGEGVGCGGRGVVAGVGVFGVRRILCAEGVLDMICS